MQLISKFDKGIRFLLCVADTFNKHAWDVPLKGRKVIAITNAFQKFLSESDCKPNEIWVDKEIEFYNRSMKSRLQRNDIEMYSPHHVGKSVVTERFLRILKNKIYKYRTSVCISAN